MTEMVWPRRRRKVDDAAELEMARKRVEEQKAAVAAQRKEVDEVAETHRRVLVENHLAEAVRNALRNVR